MPSLFSRIKTWVSLEKLTASDLNAEFNNILDNLDADQVGGSSATVGNMQTTEDPGEVGSESLASSIEGEIRRMRTLLKEITGKTQWYESPDRSLDSASQYNALTLVDTDTDPDISDKDILFFDTSSGAIDLTGFVGGASEQILFLVTKDTTNTVTVRHNGAGTQKIKLEGGADKVLPAAFQGGLILTFDGTDWVETGTGITDGEVTEDKIATDAVTTIKIKDLNVTAAKLAVGIIPELNTTTFNNSGTFTVPSDVTRVLVLACGGGGGGGGADASSGVISAGGGSGGQGSTPTLVSVAVTPLGVVSVTIGAVGSAGVAGTISSPASATAGGSGGFSRFGVHTFLGAPGGNPSNVSVGGTSPSTTFSVQQTLQSFGGAGGTGSGGGSGPAGSTGGLNMYGITGASGGAGGAALGGQGGGAGGGGGGYGISIGGVGGVAGGGGADGGGGGSPVANSGAGGGGGGGGGEAAGPGRDSGNGGAGGKGVVFVFYVSTTTATGA